MKARKIRKAREKIKEKRYINRRINKLKERLTNWRRFEQFECSSFFRGREVAELNQKIYDKYQTREANKLEWYLKKKGDI